MDFRYIDHNNIEYSFAGTTTQSGLASTDLKGWEWTRNTSGNRVSLSLEARECAATISITGNNAPERMSALVAAFDADIRAKTTGRLFAGDWYLDCYGVKGECSLSDGVQVYEVTFVAPIPLWRHETTWSMEKCAKVTGSGMDYPHDFPTDYGASSSGEYTIDADAFSPCDIRLIVYGECDNPTITIGKNVYSVMATLADGSYMVIDSTKKGVPGASVYMRTISGVYTNLFDKRERGDEGSGTYMFEKVPAGEQLVSWNGEFGFDLTLIENRSVPSWT